MGIVGLPIRISIPYFLDFLISFPEFRWSVLQIRTDVVSGSPFNLARALVVSRIAVAAEKQKRQVKFQLGGFLMG